jgi:hypothetical protein
MKPQLDNYTVFHQYWIQLLDAGQREVVELRFLAGLSLKDVTLVMDKSVPAAKALQPFYIIKYRYCGISDNMPFCSFFE